ALTAKDPLPAAKAAVDELKAKNVDAIVALVHVDYATAKKLFPDVRGVDVAVIGHEGRYQPPEVIGDTLLVGGGDRGRQVCKLVMWTATQGHWANAGEGDTALAELESITASVKTAETRLASAKNDAEKKAYQNVIDTQVKRA